MGSRAGTTQSTWGRRLAAYAVSAMLTGMHGIAGAASPEGDIERYEGYAHAGDGTSLLYRETHWLYQDAGAATRLVLYRCADGSPFARKLVRAVDLASNPDFEFTDGRDGHREGVRQAPAGREVYWQERTGLPERAQLLGADRDVVIDAGFDAYIRAHWEAISVSAPLSARLLLPSRAALLDVRIEDGTTAPDRVAGQRRIKVRLDAWYAFALPTMTLVYGEDRRLREFNGIGTIRDAHGRHPVVTIRFPPDQRAKERDEAAIQAAARVELTGRCAP